MNFLGAMLNFGVVVCFWVGLGISRVFVVPSWFFQSLADVFLRSWGDLKCFLAAVDFEEKGLGLVRVDVVMPFFFWLVEALYKEAWTWACGHSASFRLSVFPAMWH